MVEALRLPSHPSGPKALGGRRGGPPTFCAPGVNPTFKGTALNHASWEGQAALVFLGASRWLAFPGKERKTDLSVRKV